MIPSYLKAGICRYLKTDREYLHGLEMAKWEITYLGCLQLNIGRSHWYICMWCVLCQSAL